MEVLLPLPSVFLILYTLLYGKLLWVFPHRKLGASSPEKASCDSCISQLPTDCCDWWNFFTTESQLSSANYQLITVTGGISSPLKASCHQPTTNWLLWLVDFLHHWKPAVISQLPTDYCDWWTFFTTESQLSSANYQLIAVTGGISSPLKASCHQPTTNWLLWLVEFLPLSQKVKFHLYRQNKNQVCRKQSCIIPFLWKWKFHVTETIFDWTRAETDAVATEVSVTVSVSIAMEPILKHVHANSTSNLVFHFSKTHKRLNTEHFYLNGTNNITVLAYLVLFFQQWQTKRHSFTWMKCKSKMVRQLTG